MVSVFGPADGLRFPAAHFLFFNFLAPIWGNDRGSLRLTRGEYSIGEVLTSVLQVGGITRRNGLAN